MKTTYSVRFDSGPFAPETNDAVANALFELERGIEWDLSDLGDQSVDPTDYGDRNLTRSSWLLSVPHSIDLVQVHAIVEKALKKVHMLGRPG